MTRPALLVAVLLAGCSAPAAPASISPSIGVIATASPTPEPTPAMVRLTGTALPHDECWFEVPLDEGTEIRVRDGAGELIALGKTGERLGDDGLALEVDFEVPEADFYVIEVGSDDTEDQTFSLAEVQEGDILLVANC
jgi:hypothetical protein